jgi:hypothetical protein
MKRKSTINIIILSAIMLASFAAGAQDERSSRSSRTNRDDKRESSSSTRSERTNERSTTAVRTDQSPSRSQASPERTQPNRSEPSRQQDYQRSTSNNSVQQPASQQPQVRTQSQRESRTEAIRTESSTATPNNNESTTYQRRSDYSRPDRSVTTTTRTVETRSYDNHRNDSFDRRNDNHGDNSYERRYYNNREEHKNGYRYEGHYEGRWDNQNVERWRTFGYGKPRYVVYNQTRIYRAPYFSGIIRVRPPHYNNMPVVYEETRIGQPFRHYRPYWANDYDFVRRWVFFPRLNIYWDNYSNVFVYMRHNRWRISSRLPGLYFNVDLLNEPLFEVEENYDSEDGYFDDGYYYYED